MEKLKIIGGKPLKGIVPISPAKNAYLPILASLCLTDRPVELLDIPQLRDMTTMMRLLQNLGVQVDETEKGLSFDASKIHSYEATYDLVKTMRASIFVLGPLLARFKKARVSLPGGCAIGTRPIDIHLSNLEKMGAKIQLDGGYVHAETKELVGTTLPLAFPSVGATENLMMAAVYAKGETIIENAAREPEIDDLANFLNGLGAKISGIGTSILRIQGVTSLGGGQYRAIGDRIEAATYLAAGLATHSDLTVENINPQHLDFVIETFRDMGAQIELSPSSIRVLPSQLKSVTIDTAPFPGFPTDVQAQVLALATQAEGSTIITEHIFENRFMHVPELVRMGAKIDLKGNTAIVKGRTPLRAAPVMCTDLRASAALVIAGLAAKGETIVDRIYHLDRGYENLERKLSSLGAEIRRFH